MTKSFADWGYVLHSNTTPTGRGAAAIIFYHSWSLLSSWLVEQCHLFAYPADLDGVLHHFCVCHFHRDADERRRQLNKLSLLPDALIPRESIFLSDRNSVLVLSRDTSAPHLAPEHPTITSAKEAEVILLTQRNLVDFYACFLTGRHADFDLEGWTWGFPPVQSSAPIPANLASNEVAPPSGQEEED